MSSAGVPSFEKEHLWLYLQALGFEPGPATAASGKIVSLTHFGPNMFDKLNRDAFQIVSYFLFQVLDQSLTKEVFKFCWPPFDQKRDAEFRKHCCEWLKKIHAECGGSFPQVVGSLFISPGGPKFVHLMYHFARYVALKYIKTYYKNSHIRLADTFNVKPQDLHKCIARNHVARKRFFQILQRQDWVIRKYQENAQLTDKEVRKLRMEGLGLQNHIKKLEPYGEQSNLQEKVQKVRSLWASVNETLMFLEREREIVSSVLNFVNQYSLDGTNIAINIPRLLLEKIEKQVCQLHIGNVYEAGKLNLLTVIQLLNEVLKIMKYEQWQADQARLTINLQYLEKETRFQKERLLELKHVRCKVKEDLTAVRRSILEKQGEWFKKWTEYLGLSPFSLTKGCTPAVDLLPPMSPLSFDPASEEVYAKSILLKYPASFPDIPDQCNQENVCRTENDTLGTINEQANSSASCLLQSDSFSDRNSVNLLEKDMNMKTPKGKNKTASKKTSQFEVEASPPTITAGNAENTENSTVGTSLQAKKCDPFQKEQDHLVDEVARAVLSDSPKLYEGKEVQELIDSLVSNPFLTRKQIPRTPENLINEIRSSWRKAIENEDDGSAQPIQMNSEHREVLSASLPVLHNQPECSMPSFLSTTTLSDISQSSLPEEVVSDCLKRVPQEHVTASQRGDTPAQNHSDLLNKKRACRQDLERTDLCTELSQTSQTETLSPAVQNRMDVMDGNKDKYVELLDHLQACNKEHSMQKRTLWNSFQLSSGISSKSFEDADFGILHETLPEEVGHLSLNSSNTSEFNFELEPNSPMPSGNFPDDTVGGIQTTPKSDLNLQAICRRYEALKKSLSKKMEDSYHSCPETLERQKPELSLTPNKMQTDDMLNFLDVHDLHTDYSKTSFRETLSERKRSLSPLIKFSPEEQRLRTIIPISLGEFLPNLKVSFAEDEIQSENLDAEKSPSDLKR